MANSTPIDERRAIVLEALVSSAQQYHSDDLDLEETLEKDMRNRLAAENRKYFPDFRTASLEQPIRLDGESKFSIADTIEASTLGGIDGVEERIIEEQFLACLTGRERRVYRMLLDGSKLSAIARQCGCSEEDVERAATASAKNARRSMTRHDARLARMPRRALYRAAASSATTSTCRMP